MKLTFMRIEEELDLSIEQVIKKLDALSGENVNKGKKRGRKKGTTLSNKESVEGRNK